MKSSSPKSSRATTMSSHFRWTTDRRSGRRPGRRLLLRGAAEFALAFPTSLRLDRPRRYFVAARASSAGDPDSRVRRETDSCLAASSPRRMRAANRRATVVHEACAGGPYRLRAISSTPCSHSRSQRRRSTRSGWGPLRRRHPRAAASERRSSVADHPSARLAAARADARLRARAGLGRSPDHADRRRAIDPAAVPALDRPARALLLPRRPRRAPACARRRRPWRRAMVAGDLFGSRLGHRHSRRDRASAGSCSPRPTASASSCAASGSSPRSWLTAPSAWSGSASRRRGSPLRRNACGSGASSTTSSPMPSA